MNAHTKLIALALPVLVICGLALLPVSAIASSRPYYKPCPSIAKELTLKINRLKIMAAERRAQGDAYGDRRLRSMANVISAHRGNLPCVNRQTCAL